VARTNIRYWCAAQAATTDDVKLAGEAHAVIVRSRIPHGIIKHIDK